MVDGNCWIGKFDMARDGIHLNTRGAQNLGTFLVKSFILAFWET
jgi:hypothetical protein